MNPILKRKELAPGIIEMELKAPRVAPLARPGQFVILRIDDPGERFPLTIAGVNVKNNSIKIVFNAVGRSTKQLGKMEKGGIIRDVVGPLGKPSEVEKFGRVLCIGGGVMAPAAVFLAGALKDAGNHVTGIVGARTRSQLLYEKEMKKACDEFFSATDDGSRGNTGLAFMTDLIKDKKIDRVIAMSTSEETLRNISELTRPLKVPTFVSLAPIMVDGTGMCGACRVFVNDQMKLACIDGPEFDGHCVHWESILKRKRMFVSEERMAQMLTDRFPDMLERECGCGAAQEKKHGASKKHRSLNDKSSKKKK